MNKPTFFQWQEGTYSLPGSFELKMFEAYQVADERNREKLKAAFPYFFGKHMDAEIATGTAYAAGDPSVGIHGQEYSFQLHRENITDNNSRETYRREMQKLYREVADEVVSVYFDDEYDEDISSGVHQKQGMANKLIDLERSLLRNAPVKSTQQNKLASSLNTPFRMNVTLTTDGDDHEEQLQYLISKLTIIHQYIPFQAVHGTMDCSSGVHITLDTGMSFKGKYSGDPLLVTLSFLGQQHLINFHPFGGMGEFNATEFEAGIRRTLRKILSGY